LKQRQAALDAVRNAPEHYIVEIKPKTRSIDQNSLLWALLNIAANNVLWPVNGKAVYLLPEDWKDIFTASLNQENRISKGVRGGFVMLGKSTSKMSVAQMTELIEFIYSFLAEQGIDVQEQETIGDSERSTLYELRNV
jgi:hypothetical protein